MQVPEETGNESSSDAQFLKETSGIFVRAAPEDAVRLALTLLGVWFSWMFHVHPPPQNGPNIFRSAAVTKIRELARTVAMWPVLETRLEKRYRDTRLEGWVSPGGDGMWDREVAQLVAEIARVIAEETRRRPRWRTKTAATVPDSESDSDSDASTKVDEGEPADSGAKGDDVQLPIVLDPQNCLPTLALIPPHGPGARSEARSEHEPEPECDVRLAVAPTEEIPWALVSASPEVVSAVRERHSISETASAILTGFFFGALLVVALSAQRRPAPLLVS
ncbi:hypothetical protein B0H13DRAFT_2340746 [Mycena leptocephala]|nr:hypothetical protein B0H13DRAFT_2340746 [Mycena leptocephala]